ncbi:hypothetical protein E0H26_22180 [Micromonospora zingiberis]|uniref:Uncharacterized protein n=1 Tax=Micromonospora zingiberis TaxID=2053011 RepID=A0A4V2LVN5_9ACTN|nr:hypothetical protein [Micromonospora zingiberis]TCB93475.1 hypothetical protein E0H26_22180 [Micromonospora zingiberis]
MTVRRTRCLALFALVVILSGCSIGDIRRTPPAPPPISSSPDPSGPPPPSASVAETRVNRLAVPSRYDRPHVEFVDADQGYALFAACDGQPPDPDCRALLWSTGDGGRSWQRLRHPKPVADEQQMFTAPGVLALSARPYGWWTSTDGGKTFRHSPGEAVPARWQAAQGRFQIIEGTGEVGSWAGEALHALPVQPPLPALTTVVQGAGRTNSDGGTWGGPVVAAGATADHKLHAAISWNEGATWRETRVPAPDGTVDRLRLAAVAGEIWLVGERPDRMGFPALWRLAGESWQLVRAEGQPESGQVVPLGAGVVAVLGPQGPGAVVGGRYVDLPWPLTKDDHLRLLSDSTLFATTPEGILLGSGHFGDRTWTAVIIETD